MNSVSQEESSK